jgi:hypothetical protein
MRRSVTASITEEERGRDAVRFQIRGGWQSRHGGRAVHEDGLMETPIEISRGWDLDYPHAARAADGKLITWAGGGPVRRVHVDLFPVTGYKEEQ